MGKAFSPRWVESILTQMGFLGIPHQERKQLTGFAVFYMKRRENPTFQLMQGIGISIMELVEMELAEMELVKMELVEPEDEDDWPF